MTILAAIGILNVAYALVGAAILRRLTTARQPHLPFLCLAALTGYAAVGVGSCVAASLGARPSLLVVAALAVGMAAIAILLGPAPGGEATERSWLTGPLERRAISACTWVTCVFLCLTFVAAIRASPWLDDTATIWIPRGLTAAQLGLDERLFTPSEQYSGLGHADYPLLWSLALALPMQIAGDPDPRVPLIQTVVLLGAFAGTVFFLLQPLVRPVVASASALIVVILPELLRQTQSGGADLPLAFSLVAAALAGAAWLHSAGGWRLFLVGLFMAAALSTKAEGMPQVLLVGGFLVLGGALVARHRVRPLIAAFGAAGLTFLPFMQWRVAQKVGSLSEIPLASALDPAYLMSRVERVAPAAEAFRDHLFSTSEWLGVVPLAIIFGIVASVARRRVWLLLPPLFILTTYAFWIWVNWADPIDLTFRLSTSAYRVIDPIVIGSAIYLPIAVDAAVPGLKLLAARAKRRLTGTPRFTVASRLLARWRSPRAPQLAAPTDPPAPTR